MTIPNLLESCISALEADAAQRRARLAVRVLGLARAGGLPADQAALLTALGDQAALAPTGDHLWLRYERLSDTRFRVIVDPASPAPDFDMPGRMAGRTVKSGTPAAPEPLVWNRNAQIELPVPVR